MYRDSFSTRKHSSSLSGRKLLSCFLHKSIWEQQKQIVAINSLDRSYKHRHRSLNLIWLAIKVRSSMKIWASKGRSFVQLEIGKKWWCENHLNHCFHQSVLCIIDSISARRRPFTVDFGCWKRRKSNHKSQNKFINSTARAHKSVYLLIST